MRHQENADRVGSATLWDYLHRDGYLSEHPNATITISKNGPYIVKGTVPVAELHH